MRKDARNAERKRCVRHAYLFHALPALRAFPLLLSVMICVYPRFMTAKAATPAASPSAITLPTKITPGPIVELLRQGKFNEALTQLDQQLKKPGNLARNLYLKGMAQLELADKTGKRVAYLDAGLSFMRVVTYFPDSAFFGPALVETGYVHHKIGRDDLARSLYDRAQPLIDPKTDPAYNQRLNKLESGLKKSKKAEKQESTT